MTINRRKFLRQTAALGPMSLPLSQVFSSILLGQSNQQQARRYVGFHQAGAPSRWTFDLFITPYDRGNLIANSMVATRFVSDGQRYVDTEYHTFVHQGINFPHLWSLPLPHTSGGYRPMTDLAASMMVIQGISTGNPGHGASQKLHFQANGAPSSIPAMAADGQETALNALHYNVQNYQFRSLRGKSSLKLTGSGNLLSKILNPFNSHVKGSLLNYRQELGVALKAARESMNNLQQVDNPSIQALIADKAKAHELMERGFSDLDQAWQGLVQKYNNLVWRAIDPSHELPGLSDAPIGVPIAQRDKRYQKGSSIVQNSDLRTLFDSSVTAPSLVHSFALAEYLLTRGLCYTINLGLERFSGKASMGFDEHNSGQMPVLLINSFYNRALASCLLEFTDRLKEEGLFRGTIIEMGGEFNRSPKADGSGSDHGWQGKSVAIFSGDIQGPYIVGNLRQDSRQTYKGSWGHGASIPDLGEQLNIGHWSVSCSRLLGVPAGINSASSIIEEKDTYLKPLIPNTRYES